MTDIKTEFGTMRIGINESMSAVLIVSTSFDGQSVTVGVTKEQAHAIITAIATEIRQQRGAVAIPTAWEDRHGPFFKGLSMRCRHALQRCASEPRHGVKYLHEVTSDILLRVRYCGIKTANEIMKWIEKDNPRDVFAIIEIERNCVRHRFRVCRREQWDDMCDDERNTEILERLQTFGITVEVEEETEANPD